MKRANINWRLSIGLFAAACILVAVFFLKLWLPVSEWILRNPGPAPTSILLSIIFVVLGVARAARRQASKTNAPSTGVFHFIGPLDLLIEHVGSGFVVYGCLRGLDFVMTQSGTFELADRIAVGAAFLLVLYAVAMRYYAYLRELVVLETTIQ